MNDRRAVDDKGALHEMLGLPPNASFGSAPSLPSTSPYEASQAKSPMQATLSTPQPSQAISPHSPVSVHTPSLSPHNARFRSLAANSSPSHTPSLDANNLPSSPTTGERLEEILQSRRVRNGHSSSVDAGNLQSRNNAELPQGLEHGGQSTDGSPKGPRTDRAKSNGHTISTPLSKVLSHRRIRSTGQTPVASSQPSNGATLDSITESESQGFSANVFEPVNRKSRSSVEEREESAGAASTSK